MKYLISYPFSGNTWVRTVLEKYTRKSTRSVHEYRGIFGETIDGPLFYTTPETVIWKSHSFHFPDGTRPDKDDKVVFLLRDYKDALLRSSFVGGVSGRKIVLHWKRLFEAMRDSKNPYRRRGQILFGAGVRYPLRWFLQTGKRRIVSSILGVNNPVSRRMTLQNLQSYCELLAEFDVSCTQKLLIYYEDLIKDSPKEFERILSFLDIPVDRTRISKLAESKEQIFQEIRQSVWQSFAKEMSKDMNFVGRHKNILGGEKADLLDKFVAIRYPILGNKYLIRYQKS